MLTPPQRSNLPQVVEPRRLVNQGVTLTGPVDPALCVRLAEAVIEISDPIEVDLRFDTSDQGRKVVHVNASTTVLVACQRCLEPMRHSLVVEAELGIVWSEDEAKSLPRDLDPWIVTEETGDIAALVEDELLLALPFVIYHPDDQCSGGFTHSTDEELEESSPRDNPFSILEQLKK